MGAPATSAFPKPPARISQGPAVAPGRDDYWMSVGGELRGCHNKVTFGVDQRNVPNPRQDRFTMKVTWPWGGLLTSTCTPANTANTCERADESGQTFWSIGY